MFTELPIDSLTDNKVEMLNVSLIKILLYNRRYKINPLNTNFDDLPFDGDDWLIVRQKLYSINDNIEFI